MAKKPNSNISDDELVIASLLGDLEAFDVLVRRYRSAVTAVAQQVVGSRDVAEEVAQESFLLAFRELPQLNEIDRFAGWLCAIARHRARRVAAREGRSEAQEPSALDIIVLAGSSELSLHPAEEVERQAEHSEIAQALSMLPPEYQIVLRLRYYEEWKIAQIALFLSLPTSTVKWRLHHGRELMRRHLTQSNSEKDHARDTTTPSPARDSATRNACKPNRPATTARRVVAARSNRARGQPDRLPGSGQSQRGPAIQSRSASG